jgi:hypothetical protein
MPEWTLMVLKEDSHIRNTKQWKEQGSAWLKKQEFAWRTLTAIKFPKRLCSLEWTFIPNLESFILRSLKHIALQNFIFLVIWRRFSSEFFQIPVTLSRCGTVSIINALYEGRHHFPNKKYGSFKSFRSVPPIVPGAETCLARCLTGSHGSAIGIVADYWLDDRGARVQVPVRSQFSLQVVQNGSGVHPVLYTMGTGRYITGVKAAGAWSWPLISN